MKPLVGVAAVLALVALDVERIGKKSQSSGEQLAGWESELEAWKQRVTDFMNITGWKTEVVPFQQAADKAGPVQGIDNLVLKRERRRRRMALYNQKLDDVAQRRIAFAQ
jgi:hypothetical protein